MPSSKLVLAVAAASVATLVASLVLRRGTRGPGTAEAQEAALSIDVLALERQVRALREVGELQGPRSRQTESGVGNAGARVLIEEAHATSHALLEKLDLRLDEIERLQADVLARSPEAWRWPGPHVAEIEALEARLAGRMRARDDLPHIEWLGRVGGALSIEAIGRLRNLALDSDADVRVRLEAIRALNLAEGRLDAELVDAAICTAAVQIARVAADWQVRKDAYSQIEGETHPFLRQELLGAALGDLSPAVRDEAVAALAHFLPDSEIEQALRRLMTSDPDPRVREEAEEALEDAVR